MRKITYMISFLLTVTCLASCGHKEGLPKVEIGIDWKILKQSVVYASVTQNTWNMPEKPSLPNPEINIKEMFPPLSAIDLLAVSEGTSKKIGEVSAIIEKRKDEFTNFLKGTFSNWDLNKIATRADNIANIMHIRQPFREIVIQPDPVLLWGLSRTIIDGDKATIILPTFIHPDSFDAAYITALISNEMKDKNPDISRLDDFCKRNGAFLPAWDQFASDMGFAMSTWISGTMEPDYRSYILKSSLEFGHIFTPQASQWAGNFFQFLGNTTLAQCVENAVKDCENPLYQKLFDRLKDSAWLGFTLEDTKEGVKIVAFVSDEASASGLLKDDIIYEIDSIPVKAQWNVQNIMLDKAPGDEAIIKVKRGNDNGSVKALTNLGEEGGRILLAYKLKLAAKTVR